MHHVFWNGMKSQTNLDVLLSDRAGCFYFLHLCHMEKAEKRMPPFIYLWNESREIELWPHPFSPSTAAFASYFCQFLADILRGRNVLFLQKYNAQPLAILVSPSPFSTYLSIFTAFVNGRL